MDSLVLLVSKSTGFVRRKCVWIVCVNVKFPKKQLPSYIEAYLIMEQISITLI